MLLVKVRVLEGGGVDGGWTPLPIRPQRYCDQVSKYQHLTKIHRTGWFGFHIILGEKVAIPLERLFKKYVDRSQTPVS